MDKKKMNNIELHELNVPEKNLHLQTMATNIQFRKIPLYLAKNLKVRQLNLKFYHMIMRMITTIQFQKIP